MKTKSISISVVIIFILATVSVYSQGNKVQTANPSYSLSASKKQPFNYMPNIAKDRIDNPYLKSSSQILSEFDTICSENFDSGSQGWTFQDLWSESFWHISTSGAYSGYSYWCGIEELGGYDDLWAQTLTSPGINLSGTTSPVLTFKHRFNVEASGQYFGFDGYDALAIRVSTDGDNFALIYPAEGLQYTAENAFGFYQRFGSGMAGWTGNSAGWKSASFNLDNYIGQTIWVQFLFGSDISYSSQDDPTLYGWKVDDVLITDGVNTIFMDDAGDTGNVQFIAGGPGGPNPWHLTADASVSPPNSLGCFDEESGNYFPGMKAALTSPAISIGALSSNTTKIEANMQVKGRIDHTVDNVFFDIIAAEARKFDNGTWSYWTLFSTTQFIPAMFCGYNESNYFDLDLTSFLNEQFAPVGADSIQLRIMVTTLPDGNVISPANVFIDDFTLVGRSGYNGQQFGTFYNQISITPWSERQAVVDSFMATLPTCPVVEDNSVVTFLYQGIVNSVNVPGDVNSWNTSADPMTRIAGTDLWFYQTSYEPDARLEYKFFVNEATWINDPCNPNQANYEFENSQIALPDYLPPSEIEYNEGILHGNYHDTLISSAILGNTRTVRIYTPPSYATSMNTSFPVVLIHDGLTFYNYGKINNVLDNLIAEDRIQPVIAVFVPPVNRDAEYAFNLTSQFETFIVDELMPVIDSKYRTRQDPAGRAMAGFSFGGLISTQICYNRPESFGSCAAFSPAYAPKNYEVFKNVVNGPKKTIKFYMDCGTHEEYGLILFAGLMKESLISNEYDLVWNEWHEGHNYGNWRAHLDNALEYFFPASSGVAEDKKTDPFSLKSFPNPFNTNTTVTYHLSESTLVNISIYDVSGKKVYNLLNDRQTAGQHTLIWNGENSVGVRVKEGVYIVRMKADMTEVSQKLILSR